MPHSILRNLTAFLCATAMLAPLPVLAAAPAEMKQLAAADVDANAKLVQQMVDQVFSLAYLWRFECGGLFLRGRQADHFPIDARRSAVRSDFHHECGRQRPEDGFDRQGAHDV